MISFQTKIVVVCDTILHKLFSLFKFYHISNFEQASYFYLLLLSISSPTMSKKKSKGESDEQQIRAQMRRRIRKDMRSMFAAQGNIDTQNIISKYLQSHPGEDEFIKSVATR